MHSDVTIPAVVTLNACKLTGSDLRRRSKLYPNNMPGDYEAAFDADTLWYDAIQTGGGGSAAHLSQTQ